MGEMSHEANFASVPLYSSFTKDKIFPPQPGDKKKPEIVGGRLNTELNEYMMQEIGSAVKSKNLHSNRAKNRR